MDNYLKKGGFLKIRLLYAVLILGSMAVIGAASVIRIIWNGQMKMFIADQESRETILYDSIPGGQEFLIPARRLNQVLDRRYFPSENFLLVENGQIIRAKVTLNDPNAAADNVAKLKAACDAENKDFLYVVFPGKPLDDEDVRMYGVPCFLNENADSMLSALSERDVPYLDLRKDLSDLSGGDLYKWFYKSDHHWTADAGVEAARLIINDLNLRYSAGLSEEALDKSTMTRTVLENPWVGEMGEKILGSFGPDDRLVVWKPEKPAHLHLSDPAEGTDQDGGFELFLHQEVLDSKRTEGGESWYYYYMAGNHTLVTIENKDRDQGNLLVIKDSFSNVVVPYLSLSSAHVTTWDMRDNQEILSYLKEHSEIQTVIVMYTTAFCVNSTMNAFQ